VCRALQPAPVAADYPGRMSVQTRSIPPATALALVLAALAPAPARADVARAAISATATPAPKPGRLVLTLDRTKLTAAPGTRVRIGYALGRAAKVVLRVKHAGRTVEIVRVSGREGRGTLTWDGLLGATAAPAGAYRLDVYAVAADGHAARASAALLLRA
jgi:hypothetical protein